MEDYDREKLYQEVWSEPMTAVAKRYGVSDVALKKACRKLNVSNPGVDVSIYCVAKICREMWL